MPLAASSSERSARFETWTRKSSLESPMRRRASHAAPNTSTSARTLSSPMMSQFHW